jgi:hypothetical protein
MCKLAACKCRLNGCFCWDSFGLVRLALPLGRRASRQVVLASVVVDSTNGVVDFDETICSCALRVGKVDVRRVRLADAMCGVASRRVELSLARENPHLEDAERATQLDRFFSETATCSTEAP